MLKNKMVEVGKKLLISIIFVYNNSNGYAVFEYIGRYDVDTYFQFNLEYGMDE